MVATGIGLEISRSFALAGISRICIVSRRADVLVTAKKTLELEYPGLQVETYAASITNYSGINEIVSKIGKSGVLVLGAAYAHGHDAIQDVPLEGMEGSYNANVIGNWNLVRLVLASRQDHSQQCILINVSTFATYLYLTFPHQAAYGPSKAAFTQIMSEFAKNTPRQTSALSLSTQEQSGRNRQDVNFRHKEIFEGLEDEKLPGHFAVWLASPEANFLHGRFVWAQRGVDDLLQLKDNILDNPSMLKIGLVL